MPTARLGGTNENLDVVDAKVSKATTEPQAIYNLKCVVFANRARDTIVVRLQWTLGGKERLDNSSKISGMKNPQRLSAASF